MAAELKSLILCDFAQIREGLLFVQSGGLTRMVAPSFPAAFNCFVATVMWLPPDEAASAHQVVMKVKSVGTAALTATVQVAVHESTTPSGLRPGEGRQIPIVVPLASVAFPAPGEYDLQVEVDDQFAGDISFLVAHRTSPLVR